MNTVRLREAGENDVAFAFQVTESAMREHVETTWGPWVIEEQRELHARSFNPQTHSVVLVDETPCGILALEEHRDHVQLEKLYLLPDARNQGVGSTLLKTVVERSSSLRKAVRLRVLAVNTSAQRFYLRHGFLVTSSTAERVFMERPMPNPAFQRSASPPLN